MASMPVSILDLVVIGVILISALLAAVRGFTREVLAIGGALYSIGVVFHVWRTLPFQNAIWHGFVVAATACHYGTIWASLNGMSMT